MGVEEGGEGGWRVGRQRKVSRWREMDDNSSCSLYMTGMTAASHGLTSAFW